MPSSKRARIAKPRAIAVALVLMVGAGCTNTLDSGRDGSSADSTMPDALASDAPDATAPDGSVDTSAPAEDASPDTTLPMPDTAPPMDTSVGEPPPPDLASVVWLHTDVSSWPETATLSSVTFPPGQICLDYDRADVWSIVTIGGDTDVVGNPWVFIYQDSTWYGGTWEWLRPGQTCKNETSVAGDHIKRAPFDEASGWRPTSGQVLYFMVSGLARASERNAMERTNLIRVVWP